MFFSKKFRDSYRVWGLPKNCAPASFFKKMVLLSNNFRSDYIRIFAAFKSTSCFQKLIETSYHLPLWTQPIQLLPIKSSF